MEHWSHCSVYRKQTFSSCLSRALPRWHIQPLPGDTKIARLFLIAYSECKLVRMMNIFDFARRANRRTSLHKIVISDYIYGVCGEGHKCESLPTYLKGHGSFGSFNTWPERTVNDEAEYEGRSIALRSTRAIISNWRGLYSHLEDNTAIPR